MEGGRPAAAVGGGEGWEGGRMRSAMQCNAMQGSPMPPPDTAAPSPAARAAPGNGFRACRERGERREGELLWGIPLRENLAATTPWRPGG